MLVLVRSRRPARTTRSDRPSLAAVPTVSANGIELYYERWGQGPRLLFFNGSGSSIATSELLIKLFTNDFEVLVHDQRGTRPQRDPGRSVLDGRLRRRRGRVARSRRLGRTRVVGVSFGGMVAQEFAVTCPDASSGWRCCARRRAAPAARRTRCTSSRRCPQEEQTRRGDAAPRHALHARVARRASGRPRARRHDGGAARCGEDGRTATRRGRAARGAQPSRRDAIGCGAVTCPTFVASGRFDGIAPSAQR